MALQLTYTYGTCQHMKAHAGLQGPSVQVLCISKCMLASMLLLPTSSPTLKPLQSRSFPPTAPHLSYNPGPLANLSLLLPLLIPLSSCPPAFSHTHSLGSSLYILLFFLFSPTFLLPYPLVMSSLLLFLSAVDFSKCLWIFSLSYHNKNLLLIMGQMPTVSLLLPGHIYGSKYLGGVPNGLFL